MDELNNSTGNELNGTPQNGEVTGNEVAASTPVDDYPETIKAYLEQNPNAKDVAEVLNREFKSAFTPKLQRAGELEKLVEGLDPQTIQGIRYIHQLAQNNPRQAAEYLRQQAELLYTPPAPTADPYANIEPATDAEALLLQKARELETWRAQQEQAVAQITMQQRANEVKAEVNQIEKEYGVTIPLHDQERLWQMSDATGLSITDAFFAANRSSLLPKLLQKAKDEASAIVSQKVSGVGGNPGNVSPRAGTITESSRDFDSIWKMQKQLDGI